MTKKMFYVIDTSAILSGKPINIEHGQMVTTPGVAAELKPGGRNYRTFQMLESKGLYIQAPTKNSLQKIQQIAKETGDTSRISEADCEILALALDINNQEPGEAIIVSDDYSIQNLAHTLHIRFQGFSQQGITKKFKWSCRCPGCGKRFEEFISCCPICGTRTRLSPTQKEHLK